MMFLSEIKAKALEKHIFELIVMKFCVSFNFIYS